MKELKMSKRIRMYKSFEEMNEGDDREAAALTPLQHLSNAMTIIKHLYSYKGGPSLHRRITYIGYGQHPRR